MARSFQCVKLPISHRLKTRKRMHALSERSDDSVAPLICLSHLTRVSYRPGSGFRPCSMRLGIVTRLPFAEESYARTEIKETDATREKAHGVTQI